GDTFIRASVGLAGEQLGRPGDVGGGFLDGGVRRCRTEQLTYRPTGLRGQVTQRVEPLLAAHQTSSRSTTTGAWSDGSLPFRAFRSITAQRTRSLNGADMRTRSMRMPRPS